MTGISINWSDLLGPILSGVVLIIYESYVKKSKKGKKSSGLIVEGVELAASMYVGNLATVWMSSSGILGITSELISKVLDGVILATVRTTINKEKFIKKAAEGALIGFAADAVLYPLGVVWASSPSDTGIQSNIQDAAGAPYNATNPMNNH